MLKISAEDKAGGKVVLRIEGTLGGAWVAEVRAACDGLIAARKPVVLDLGGVTYVDRAGVELLARLRADRRVAITAASVFVSELMKGGAA